METKERAELVMKHWLTMSTVELGSLVGLKESRLRIIARELGLPRKRGGFKAKEATPKERIDTQQKETKRIRDLKDAQGMVKHLMEENQSIKNDLEVALQLAQNITPAYYPYKEIRPDSEVVAVAVASDWHVEENINPDTIDGYNEFNLDIAHQRVEQFFQNVVKLVKIEQHASIINTLCLALLGDYFSSNIHEALLEICEVPPIEASIIAENMIIGGINYILEHTDLKIIIPCAVGNHSRITKKVHIATETGNSMEMFMYHHIKNHFKNEPRVEMLISKGYLSYITFWDYTICFQHGHAVKFQGGVGGITIPLRKAVAQWQKKRYANLYVLGHWHQFIDIGEAIVNGSLIGYNSYSQFIKADPERPKQAFFLVSRKHNEKICVRPILFNV